jgi:plasmid stability protein
MSNILIRNVPETLHAGLKKRAAKNNRSVNQEVIAELSAWNDSLEADRKAITRSRMRMRKAGKQVEELRSRMPYFMKAKQIDLAVAEGRK